MALAHVCIILEHQHCCHQRVFICSRSAGAIYRSHPRADVVKRDAKNLSGRKRDAMACFFPDMDLASSVVPSCGN